MGIFSHKDGERPSIRELTKQAKKAEDPNQAALLLTQAGAYAVELGKTKKALTLLHQAIEKAPDHGPASAQLEALLRAQGDGAALRAEQERRLAILTAARGDAREIAAMEARLAHTEEHLGRPAEAFTHYTHAFELDPAQIGVAQAARRIAMQTERWEDAVDILEKEIAVEPDRARRSALICKRASTLRDRLGRLDEAVQLFERAVRTDPGEVSTRRELVDTLLLRADTAQDPDRTARDRYVAADILVDLVNAASPDEQRAFVLEALDIAPEHLPALELLEQIASDDVELLMERWARNVEAFPDGPKSDDVRLRLARQHLSAGRPARALKWFEQLAKRGDLDAILETVALHHGGGRHVDARRWARAAFEVAPEEEHLALHRTLFDRIATGDPVGAEFHAFAMLAEDPDDDVVFDLIVSTRSAAGDRATLAEVYADVCARSPARRKQLLPTLGALLEELGDIEAALVCFREAETSSSGPDSLAARAARVRLAELAGNWDELADLLEEDAKGLAPSARVPILDKLATMHRGLRQDPTRATEALLALLSVAEQDRLTGVHRDLSATLEAAGTGSLALQRARSYAKSAAPELRTAIFRTLGRLHDAWGETDRAADAWNLVRATHPEDEEALGRSAELAVTQERYGPAVELLEFWVRLSSGARAVALHRRIAEICDEHLSDIDRAADALTAALDLVPDDRQLGILAADALRRAKRFGEEKIVQTVLLASAPDAKSRHAHQERIARLSATELQDPDEALRVWTQLVNETEDVRSLSKLRDDARSEGDSARLDVILARLATVEAEPTARSEHALERARVLALDLGRPSLALRVLAHAAASYAQGHMPSQEYLESLAVDAGDHRTLTRALEGQLQLVDARRKRVILRRLAELYEAAPDETTGMVRALTRWEAIAPDDVDPRLRLIPALAEREDWGGLLSRLDDLIRLSPVETQAFVDRVANAATESRRRGTERQDAQQDDNALAWFLIELAGRAKAPAQRLRLVVAASDLFESAGSLEEAFTAVTRALEMAGARPELLDRAERFAEAKGRLPKLDALYERLILNAPTEEDRVSLSLRHARCLDRSGRVDEAVDRLLRASAIAPTSGPLLEELEVLAPRSERMAEVLAAFVDRGDMLGGERAVQLLCRGAKMAYRAGKAQSVLNVLRAAVDQAGEDDTLLDFIEEATADLGREGTEQLVRVYEERGNDPDAPRRARAKALVRAALRMKDKLGLQEVAFGVLKTALDLAPAEVRVLDAIEASAAERDLLPYLDQHLELMVKASTSRTEAAVLVARQAKIYEEHLGQSHEAAEAYLRSISLNPNDEGVLRRLRFCLIETGRVQELIGVLERRLSRAPDDGARLKQLRQLAKLWEREAHNVWEAVDTWKRVLALSPDDPEATEALSRLSKTGRRPAVEPPADDADDAETTQTDAPSLPPEDTTAESKTLPDREQEEDTALTRALPAQDLAATEDEESEETTSVSVRPPVPRPPIPPPPPPVRSATKAPPPVPAHVSSASSQPPVPVRPLPSPPPPRRLSGPPPKTSVPPPIPADRAVSELALPSIADAETAELSAPSIAEAETAEIALPEKKTSKSEPPSIDGDLPSIIVDPDLLEP